MWVGAYKPKNAPIDSPSIPVYNQIDYILVAHRHRRLLQVCKAYSCTMTSSNHRLLIATIVFPARLQYCGPQSQSHNLPYVTLQTIPKFKFNISLLSGRSHCKNHQPCKLGCHIRCHQEAAHETLGQKVKPKNKHQFVTDDPEVSELSRTQKNSGLK